MGGHFEYVYSHAVPIVRADTIIRLNSSTGRIGIIFHNNDIAQKIIGGAVVLDEYGHNEDGQHESDDGILGGSPH